MASPPAVSFPPVAEQRRVRVGLSTGLFLAGALVVALVVGWYRLTRSPDAIVLRWYPNPLDWLTLLAALAVVAYGALPLVRRPTHARRLWRRFRRNRLAVVALAWLLLVFGLGIVVPAVWGKPDIVFGHDAQPPAFLGAPSYLASQCVGPVVERTCYGTLQHPLGTNAFGRDMLGVAIAGMRVAVVVSLVTATIIAPIGVLVGTVAGAVDGRTTDALMGVVDIVEVLPAFLVYIILIFVFGRSLWLVVVVFGLLSWGGVARLVRAAVAQHRSDLYVLAARNAGASRLTVVRRHVLPNVAPAVITGTTAKIPHIILAEAALSFLGLGDTDRLSWGTSIYEGFSAGFGFPTGWWLTVVPVVFLALTVASFSLVGDALRDTLDPR